MAWEFLRLRGLLHTRVAVQIAFSRASLAQRPSYLLLFGFFIHSGSRSFCAAFMRVPRAQGVGELTSECEVKVPFFSVVTQLPSQCFLSVVFCGVLAAC